MVAPVVIPVVDEGLGNSSYLVELGDHRALAVDASLDLRALRAEAERRGLRVRLRPTRICMPTSCRGRCSWPRWTAPECWRRRQVGASSPIRVWTRATRWIWAG